MGNFCMHGMMWMPNVETFCICKSLQFGAIFAFALYTFLAPLAVLKPILTVGYHHEVDTFIAYIQCVFTYLAAVFGVFTFILACYKFCIAVAPNHCLEPGETRDESRIYGAYMKNDVAKTCIRVTLIFCLVLGVCEVMWGIFAFARAFVEPGLLRVINNKTSNPYPDGHEVCRPVLGGGRRTRRPRSTCRPVTDEERRKRIQWDKDRLKLFGERYSGLEYDYRGLVHVFTQLKRHQQADHYTRLLQHWHELREQSRAEQQPAIGDEQVMPLEELQAKFFGAND